MLRILIADDHPIFRQGLRQILENHYEDLHVEEASDGAEVLHHCRNGRFDLLVMDISMPGRNGLEVLENVKKDWPEINVLMVSMHSEEQYAIRAITAGASGYITKNGAAKILVDAVEKTARGDLYISPSVAEQLAFQIKGDVQAPRHTRLSARETQILCMLAVGQGIKEIASELALSTSTVSTHRSRILKKLDMSTNAELIRYALSEGLVE
ncbi:MAG: response regulator [Calditrichia bacterium]